MNPLQEDVEFLEHFGVKGMRWGIRKKYETVGRDKNNDQESFSEESQSKQLEAKYGKDSMKEKKSVPVEKQDGFRGLSPAQKKAALALGGMALVVGAGFAYRYVGKNIEAKNLADELRYFEDTKNRLFEASKNPPNYIGLKTHWEKGVELEAGHILQRMSTVKETTINSNGFFAAYRPDDVERYKAELPNWWKRWGYKETSGYLTQLKSTEKVKAPSAKESIEIFKKVIGKDSVLDQMGSEGKAILKMSGSDRATAIDGLAKMRFQMFSMSWATPYQDDPQVKEFFRETSRRGFNALIDFNDSGQLAHTPLRVIKSDIFKIVGNKPVSAAAIAKAQKQLKELIMSLFGTFRPSDREFVDFLEHFGIKGMRWGVRKDTMPNFLPSSGNQAVKDGKIFVKSVMRQLGEKKVSDFRNIHYSHGYQILNVIQNVLDATS